MKVTDLSLSRVGHACSVLLLTALVACSDNNTESNQQQGPDRPTASAQDTPTLGIIPAVEAVRADFGSLPLEERLTGRVQASNQTGIYSEVAGPITAIYVQNGDYVDQGEALLQIRNAEIAERFEQAAAGLEVAKAQTRQAEAALELLSAQLRRTQELRERNLEALAELEIIQSEVAVAQADLDLRRAQANQAASLLQERRLQLQNTTVRAPVSGNVGQRNAELGMLVSTTTPLFIIGDLSRIRIEVLLTERMLSYIEEGTPVNLYSDNWGDTVLQSTITRISPFLDASSMRTVADIELDNPDQLLRSGMFITVDVLYGQSEQAVLIPNSAFYRHPRTGMEGVFVIQDPGQEIDTLSGTDSNPVVTPPLPVSFIPVGVVASGRMISGVSGLQQGDWVVTVGQNLLIGNVTETRARLISWERMMELQQMQSRDLFEVIDQRQQQLQSDSS